jgi:hypothetical protein
MLAKIFSVNQLFNAAIEHGPSDQKFNYPVEAIANGRNRSACQSAIHQFFNLVMS